MTALRSWALIGLLLFCAGSLGCGGGGAKVEMPKDPGGPTPTGKPGAAQPAF